MKSDNHLEEEFLAQYRAKGDNFPNLLARSTYISKYSRDNETWTDTVRRVVDGNADLATGVTRKERELLFHIFWTMQALPPGRGLWVGGVEGIPSDARFNCWFSTIYNYSDWGWVANQLMLGGGVGVGLHEVPSLPTVNNAAHAMFEVACAVGHPDILEVRPDMYFNGGALQHKPAYLVPDSREGWVSALNTVMKGAFEGQHVFVDVSAIRSRGTPIKTFGGTACGPGPLVELLRAVWAIIRGAAGRKLTSVEALDITNHIGKCIKAGNVRRSALIAIGSPGDQEFRNAKKDYNAVLSHRHTSNNSIGFQQFAEFEKFDWMSLATDNIEFGEPGVANLALARMTDPGVKGVNPCLAGDTRIATQYGLVPIADMARKASPLQVTTDTRVEPDYVVHSEEVHHQNGGVAFDLMPFGTEVRSAVPAFMTSPAERVFCITTTKGYSVKATEYHKFPTPEGFVELKNLGVGDRLLLQSGEGQWGKEGTEDLGTIIGCIEGDGNFNGDRGEVTLRFWGEQKYLAYKLLPACSALANTVRSVNGREYTTSVVDIEERDSCEITSGRIADALAEVGYRQKGSVPEVVWRGTRDCVRGYIRGLFATDGQINWSKNKQCFSIRLSQSNRALLCEVQVLLQNFGIVSSVHSLRAAGTRRMPDGNGGMKDYWCEEAFELVVSSANAKTFAEKVGFMLDTHAELYAAWERSWVRGPYKEDFTDEIQSIGFVGVEPVYCTTQASHHTFIAAGIVTGNCGEQFLEDREACNLAEVFPANFDGSLDEGTIFKLVARYCLRQRLTPLLDERSNAVGQRNMRIGVGLGGICDFSWTEDLLAKWFRVVRTAADDYARELGVSRPITTTTVKPSGTISLLNGSSPGMHAPHAEYYIRRTRHAVNDPMTQALMEAGVPWEHDKYDSSGKTLCFDFPMKAKHTRVTTESQTLTEQFERQLAVQNSWADNAVSCTISFDKDKPEELAAHLERFVPKLKSTSCLPSAHGYDQAPYESISQSRFEELAAHINFSAKLVRGGEFEVDECAGGVCPTR